jgi:hypothetical protein
MRIDSITFVWGDPFEPEGKRGFVSLPLRTPCGEHVEPWLSAMEVATREKIIDEARKLARSAKFNVAETATPSYNGSKIVFPYSV